MRLDTKISLSWFVFVFALSVSLPTQALPDLESTIASLKSVAPPGFLVPDVAVVEVDSGGIGTLGGKILVPKQVFDVYGNPVSARALETLLLHEYGHVVFETNMAEVVPEWKSVERERSRVAQAIFKLESSAVLSDEGRSQLARLKSDELKLWEIWEILEIKRGLHELAADLLAVVALHDLSAVKSALQGSGGDHPETIGRNFAPSSSVADLAAPLSGDEQAWWHDEMERSRSLKGYSDPYLMFFPSRKALGSLIEKNRLGEPSNGFGIYIQAVEKMRVSFSRWEAAIRSGQSFAPDQLNKSVFAEGALLQ